MPRLTSTSAALTCSFLWIKLALRGLSPVEVTFARLILGAAVLFAIVAARGHPLPRSPVMRAHITVAAFFANAAPYLLFALGEQKVSSSTAGILNATTPLRTVVVALATRHERSLPLRRGGWPGRRLRRGVARVRAVGGSLRAGLCRGHRVRRRHSQLRHQLRPHGQVHRPPVASAR